jgi:UDP-3-O-[3-hydroxymyristoyl] glucosamine N-acyltransferase
MTPRTLFDIAALCGASIEGDGARIVTGPASLEDANADQVSFLADRAYLAHLDTTRAAGVLVSEDLPAPQRDLTLLRCADPGRAFSRVVLAFARRPPRPAPGVHASAIVAEDVELADDVSVGPLCVIGPGARLSPGVVLHPRVTVGAACRVGADSVLHPGVVLYPFVEVGERCVLHAGSIVGSDGFGFELTASGWEKTPQAGSVVIEDDVELGANVTIDCARFGVTRIGRGVKIDNLVHVAHNVQVGAGALLLAQVGIAGSTRLGAGAILAGQVGVAGHLDIGEGARVGGGSKLFKDVPPGQDYYGAPAGPKAETLRAQAALRRVPELLERLRKLEARMREREGRGEA